MSRLGGGSIEVKYGMEHGLMVSTHSSMANAADRAKLGQQYYSSRKRKGFVLPDSAYMEMLSGDGSIARLSEAADALADEAMLEDPRLVRRAGWARDDDGVDCDPVLVSVGEELCCLNRKKLRRSDASTLEPVRVVISTDSNHASEDNAVAFMAAAKLSQQFRPLEIWWQGAWLEDNGYEPSGHVSLTPLVRNELDFGRLQFVLSSPLRDAVSYRVMFGYTVGEPTKEKRPALKYGGLTGKTSFLPDALDFVDEAGIRCAPRSVARYAAKWAGLTPLWEQELYGNEAEQTWNPKPYEYTPVTPADRKRWEADTKRRDIEASNKAKERMKSL